MRCGQGEEEEVRLVGCDRSRTNLGGSLACCSLISKTSTGIRVPRCLQWGPDPRPLLYKAGPEESARLWKGASSRGLDTAMASSILPAVLTLLLLVSPLLEASGTGVPIRPQERGTSKVTSNRTPTIHQKPVVTHGAAASAPRGSKSQGYYDLYQGGYDKGFSDLIYWVPLIIIFGAGIIFLPVLGAMFATLAAGTAGAAVSTTVAGRRRRDLSSVEGALSMLRTLEDAFEKFRSLNAGSA